MVQFILVASVFWVAFCGNSSGQKTDTSPGNTQQELLLTRANDGQHLTAKVGQPIVITLQTIGGGNYDTPQISTFSVRFDSVKYPAKQNPGGPTQIYHFTAAAVGEAQIRIPHKDSNPTVTFAIRVTKR